MHKQCFSFESDSSIFPRLSRTTELFVHGKFCTLNIFYLGNVSAWKNMALRLTASERLSSILLVSHTRHHLCLRHCLAYALRPWQQQALVYLWTLQNYFDHLRITINSINLTLGGNWLVLDVWNTSLLAVWKMMVWCIWLPLHWISSKDKF